MGENTLKAGCFTVVGAGILAVLSFGFWFINSSNPDVPAGYVGYQTQGAVFGKGSFYGTLKGPASPGRTWMVKSFPVSITPYTYSEEFSGESEVLSKDNLKINYRVHLVWRIKEDAVKDAVEKYSTIDTTGKAQDPEKVVRDMYNNYLKEPFRTFSRDEVQKLEWQKIKEQQVVIGNNIKANMVNLTKDAPFEIISVNVGNIQYPKVVSDAVADNLATTQHLEKEKKDAERRIVQAEAIAKAMDIINQKLTPNYLQHEAIEAQKAMVGSPNHTVIYIPVGNMGVPLVGTLDMSKK
jgi:regulator of protease activity HflC (stomatin/prohibitin superfamily)